MGVVLPGEADPAEHLDAVLGVIHRVVQGHRRRGRRGQRVLVRRLVRGPRRVPGQRGGPVGPAEHPGAQVLDRLERADGPAELVPGPGVLGRGVAAPAGHRGRLHRGQRRGQVPHPGRAQPGDDLLRVDDRIRPAGRRPGHGRSPPAAGAAESARAGWPGPGTTPPRAGRPGPPPRPPRARAASSRCVVLPAPSTRPTSPVTRSVPPACQAPRSVPADRATAALA